MAETEIPDTVERSIIIDAPIERVWQLVSTPGWWINKGEVVENGLQYDGDRVTVSSEWGDFVLEVVEQRAPEYAAFRWLAGTNQDNPEQELRTLTEFTLAEVDAGVEVTVVESGWSAYEPTDYVRDNYRDNVSGWEAELLAAQRFLE